MSKIICFQCTQDDEYVRWSFEGVPIVKRFGSKIYAEPFENNDRVLVVIRSKKNMPDNAVILNPDGSEYLTVRNPLSSKGDSMFTDVYYVKNHMKLILSTKIGQYSCFIDSEGNLGDVMESR